MEETGLIYLQVREKLRQKIQTMHPGEKLPAERELSEKYCVARPTLRRAIKGLETEGILVRQQGRGTFIKSSFKLGPATNTTNKILSLLIPNIEFTYHAQIMKGVEEESTKYGYSVQVSNLYLVESTTKLLKNILKNNHLAALLLYPIERDSLDSEYAETIRKICKQGTKVVVISQYISIEDVCVAMVDKVQEGYMATQHLIMLGHRKICYVSTNTYDSAGNECFLGYKQALRDYGLEYNDDLHYDFPVLGSEKELYHVLKTKLKENPSAFTAIATPQFNMTCVIMKVLDELDIKIPDDMAFVGGEASSNSQGLVELLRKKVGGDESYIKKLVHVTHTFEPAREIGREAVRLILEKKEDGVRKKHALLQPKLVLGTSCGSKQKILRGEHTPPIDCV